MKKIALIASLALATPPAYAGTNTRGLVVPQPVRYELVYEVALKACPKAAQLAPNLENMTAFINDVSERMALAPDERALLVDFCVLYAQGVVDA